MLSFDFSDRVINIVKGVSSAQKIKIERSLTVEVPEEMIVNGEVINISGLADLLITNLKAEGMMDREAVVTFSSSAVVFKELVVPKAKGSEFLSMVQNQMQQEMGISDEYSISYSIVGQSSEENRGSVKVLATACPSLIVSAFRKLFTHMGIALKSVNISCNSISRIIHADKTNIDKMPLLVCQIDDNFLGLVLFENGQMAFARYEPISQEDYESEEYLTEAISENIFRMEQFNKARGGPGLKSVVLYGKIEDFIRLVNALESLDVQASVLSVPSQISGYENVEFTIFANAIGALYQRNKQTERINLLEVEQATGKVQTSSSGTLITMFISLLVSAIIIGSVTAVFKIKEGKLNREIDSVQAEIDECDRIIAENQKLHNYLIILNEFQAGLDIAVNNLETLPYVKQEIFEKIEENLKNADDKSDDITYKGFSFNMSTGEIVLTNVQLPEQQTANDFIKTIIDQDYFADAFYSGYTGTGEEDSPVIITQVTIYIKDIPDVIEEETEESANENVEVTE